MTKNGLKYGYLIKIYKYFFIFGLAEPYFHCLFANIHIRFYGFKYGFFALSKILPMGANMMANEFT